MFPRLSGWHDLRGHTDTRGRGSPYGGPVGVPPPERNGEKGVRETLSRGASAQFSGLAAAATPEAETPAPAPRLRRDQSASPQARRGHPAGAFLAQARAASWPPPRPGTWRSPAGLCCAWPRSSYCEDESGRCSGRNSKGAPPARSAASASLTTG